MNNKFGENRKYKDQKSPTPVWVVSPMTPGGREQEQKGDEEAKRTGQPDHKLRLKEPGVVAKGFDGLAMNQQVPRPKGLRSWRVGIDQFQVLHGDAWNKPGRVNRSLGIVLIADRLCQDNRKPGRWCFLVPSAKVNTLGGPAAERRHPMEEDVTQGIDPQELKILEEDALRSVEKFPNSYNFKWRISV